MRFLILRLLLLVSLLNGQLILPLTVHAEGERDPLWNRPSYEKKVIDIGQRLLAANGIQERIIFLVDRHDVRNAYASRYGANHIVIYKDMLDVIDSDDELAAVLSHEIAHIIKRHTQRARPKKVATNVALVTAVSAVAVGTFGLGLPILEAGGLMMKRKGIKITDPISRPYEKEADLVGLDYMVKGGYNPLAMETLQMKIGGDGSRMTRFWSSHPMGTDRIAYVHEAIQTKYPQFLTPETANSALPGSPYLLQSAESGKTPVALGTVEIKPPTAPKPVDAARPATSSAPRLNSLGLVVQPDTPIALMASAEQASKITPPATDTHPTETMASPAPVTSKAAPAAKNTNPQPGYQPAPRKVRYTAAPGSLRPAPRRTDDPTGNKPVAASSSSRLTQHKIATEAAAPTSVAQVLLALSLEDLQVLKLIRQHGYMQQAELQTQFDNQDADTLTAILENLQQKKLIRIVGAEPEQAYILTDWANDALKASR